MLIKIYDKIPEEAKMIREAAFMKEQGIEDINEIIGCVR